MIVVDSTELWRPTQRKLHAGWWELGGRQVLTTPTAAGELSGEGTWDRSSEGKTRAERNLRERPKAAIEVRERWKRQAWWAQRFRNPKTSPYGVVKLEEKQEGLVERILSEIDAKGFPRTAPERIPETVDARIVAESMALGAQMLLTSDTRTIERAEVNRWAREHGEGMGFPAQDVVFQADQVMWSWAESPEGHERLMKAGLLACWPPNDNASAREVVEKALATISAMRRGTGAKLIETADRLVYGLESHPDPERLVEEARETFPSRTVETDRQHPSYR